MKVLHINSVYRRGSTGRIVADIHDELMNQGHESFVVFGRKSGDNDVNSWRMTSNFGNYWHALMSRLTGKHGLYSSVETNKLIKKIKDFQPDIIHLHNIHGYYLNYKILFKYLKEFNGKIIWTLHDCWSYTGQCAYYSFAKCDKFTRGCYNCPQLNQYPKTFVDRSKSNYKTKMEAFTGLTNLSFVTPSNWLKDELSKSFLKDYSCNVINNGIDTSVFKDVNMEKQTPKIILGVANIWEERKGLKTFIELNKVIPKDYQIKLIGLNKKQIEELPLGIIGISRTDSIEELVAEYSSATVFFNPTLEDNYPTVNLEAQACGLPVVTFDSGGSAETLFTEGSILIGKEHINDIEFLAKKIIDINSFKTNDTIELGKMDKSFFIKKYLTLYKINQLN